MTSQLTGSHKTSWFTTSWLSLVLHGIAQQIRRRQSNSITMNVVRYTYTHTSMCPLPRLHTTHSISTVSTSLAEAAGKYKLITAEKCVNSFTAMAVYSTRNLTHINKTKKFSYIAETTICLAAIEICVLRVSERCDIGTIAHMVGA